MKGRGSKAEFFEYMRNPCREHPLIVEDEVYEGAVTGGFIEVRSDGTLDFRQGEIGVKKFMDGTIDTAMKLVREQGRKRTEEQKSIANKVQDRVSQKHEPIIRATANDDLISPDEGDLRRRWDRDPSLREEFLSFEDFVAYSRAVANGQTRIFSKEARGR